MSFDNTHGVTYAEIGRFIALARRTIQPLRDGRQAIVYPFGAVDFIGHICHDTHALRTLYPPDRYQVFFLVPALSERVDAALFRAATQGLTVVVLDGMPKRDLHRVGTTVFHDQPVLVSGDLTVVFGGSSHIARELYVRARRAGTPAARLALTPETEDAGAQWCRAHGLDPVQPLAVLHVRDSGFNPVHRYNDFRNADIDTYRPAIAALRRRDLAVIRIGDRTMAPLAIDDPLVLDLPLMPDHAPWLDAWFLARARFMIHTYSGLADLARAFRAPMLGSNGYFSDFAAGDDNHVIVPKSYVETATGRHLGLGEILDRRLTRLWHKDQLDQLGLHLVENDPGLLEEATTAFADGLDRLPAGPTQSRFVDICGRESALRAGTGGPLAEDRIFALDVPGIGIAEGFVARQPDFLVENPGPIAARPMLPKPRPER